MQQGWIKLHRQIAEHWVYKNPLYFRAWIHFLVRANHTENKVLIGNTLEMVQRGEFITSLNHLADECGMTMQQIRTFLQLLENDNMILKNSTTKLTKITVCNYESYQDDQQTNNKQTTNKQQTNNKRITTDKNDKNLKNDNNDNNKEHDPQAEIVFSFIKPFFKKQSYTESEIEKSIETIEQLIRIDKHSEDEIIETIKTAHQTQNFYFENCQSIQALRTKKDGLTKFQKLKNYVEIEINKQNTQRNGIHTANKNGKGITKEQLAELVAKKFDIR